MIYADGEDIGVRQQGMMAYKVKENLENCELNLKEAWVGVEIIDFSDWKSIPFDVLCCKNNTEFMNFTKIIVYKKYFSFIPILSYKDQNMSTGILSLSWTKF